MAFWCAETVDILGWLAQGLSITLTPLPLDQLYAGDGDRASMLQLFLGSVFGFSLHYALRG